MPLEGSKGPLTIDVQLVLRWNKSGEWEIYYPERDHGICDDTGGIDYRNEYFKVAATLHMPLNGREKPFITSSLQTCENALVKKGKL